MYLLAAALEFSWLTILLHMASLVILVGGLYALLYKPVKKMIQRRKDSAQSAIDGVERAKQEADTMREKYEALLSDMKQEAAKSSEEARKAAEEQTLHIIEGANNEAKNIIERAKAEIEKERTRAEVEMRGAVAELSAGIAAKLIGREISAKDNKKLIEDCLNKWGSDESH